MPVYGNGSFRPWLLSHFGPGSFRPGSFRPELFWPWVVLANFGGLFRLIFSNPMAATYGEINIYEAYRIEQWA